MSMGFTPWSNIIVIVDLLLVFKNRFIINYCWFNFFTVLTFDAIICFYDALILVTLS